MLMAHVEAQHGLTPLAKAKFVADEDVTELCGGERRPRQGRLDDDFESAAEVRGDVGRQTATQRKRS